MPVFTILNNILVGIATKRMFPEYSCKGKLSISVKKDIRKKVAGLMISKLAMTSRNSFDSIFISAFLGLAMTTIYSNYLLVISTITGILNIVINSLQAGIGNTLQTETKEKNYENLKKFNLIYTLFVGWCTTCMLCMYQPFMELWLGKEFLMPFGAVVLLCSYFYIMKSGDMNSLYFNASGMWWDGKYRAIAESLLNLIGNFMLVKLLGIYGIILATVISTTVGHYWNGQFLFKLYYKNNKAVKYFLFEGMIATISISICVITFAATKFIPKLDATRTFIFTLLTTGAVATILFCIAYIFVSKILKLTFSIKRTAKK